jgi:PAS domain S-box-containing protein
VEEQLRIYIVSDARRRTDWDVFFLARLSELWPSAELRFFDDAKGFAKALTKAPDLVISDLTVEELPTAALAVAMKKHSPSTPIVVAVSHDHEPVAIQAVRDGADDYVLDGSTERFEITLRNLLKRSAIERDQVRTAERLSASEIGFQHLIEHVLDIITVTDINANILFESPSLERVLGYKPEELIGRNAFAFIHPIDIATTMPVFMLAVATPGVPHAARFRFKHKDGSWRQLEAVGKTIRDPGQGVRLIVTSRDVSERTQAAAALSQSHTRFRAVVEGLSEGLVLTDANSMIT